MDAFWKLKEKKVKENYDVIVVGAGPAGIMTCYELYLKNRELEVLLIDKGHDVMNRHCPIKDKKIKQCPVHKGREPGCIPACSITAVSYTHLTLPTNSLV